VCKNLLKIPNRFGKKCLKTAEGEEFLTHTVDVTVTDMAVNWKITIKSL